MYSPRPYGRFAEQAELSPDDAAAVERLARTVTNLRATGNLPGYKRVAELPSGRMAAAIDMGGVFRVVVYERHEEPEHTFEGLAETYIPMLFSGVVTEAMVRTEAEHSREPKPGVRIRLTEQCRRRLTNYSTEQPLPPKEVELQRFLIPYHDDFKYFEPAIQGIYTFTQYHRQRPTWYSGAMAEVMQIVGGYGRQMLDQLPDDLIERARFVVPERYMRRIREQLAHVRLPGYTGVPDKEGQFRCDYRAARCHGVAFDSEGSPWLLQVSQRGVFAMPLPVVPATTLPEFRDYVEAVGDHELLAILDRFGGLPTGEPFPEGEQAFEAWRRAGVIIKVCDTADFYEHAPMYEACGWSFNSRGTEAFNTCWRFNAANLREAFAYKIKITLGAAENRGLLPLKWQFDSDEQAATVNAYLASIYNELRGNGPRELAIKYKIRRHSCRELLARAQAWRQSGSSAPDVDYWDNLEMEPIASHSGNTARVGQGPLYHPAQIPTAFGALKFPTLDGSGCASFIMSSEDYTGPAVKCDTIVFGCYVDDRLEVIKYFYDERRPQRSEESSLEPVMVVGSWERKIVTNYTGLAGHFYTTSFDERRPTAGVTRIERYTGRALGYGTPRYQSPPVFFRVGSLTRTWYYSWTEEVVQVDSEFLAVAACVPVFQRDCVLYPSRQGDNGGFRSTESERRGIQDPNSYELWAHHDTFHWMGSTRSGNKGVPPSRNGEPVYVDTHIYDPSSPESAYADQGDWFLKGASFRDVSDVLGDYTSGRKSFQGGGAVVGGDPPPYQAVSSMTTIPRKEEGKLEMALDRLGPVTVHRNIPNNYFWDFSPAMPDYYFYTDAVRVTFGDVRYANCDLTDSHGHRLRWGFTALADHKSAHHFIGVINE